MHSLSGLEAAAAHRNRVAAVYREALGHLPGVDFQEVSPADRSSYKDYSITVDPQAFGLSRDELAEALGREGVETRKYYDPPVHRQLPYREYARGAWLPNTERVPPGA